MSTQNAKRMTTWMGFRYMGHSHDQPFRQHSADRIFSQSSSADVSRMRSRSVPAKPAAKNSFEGPSPEICPRVLPALDGFDMAKTLTPS
jgi:hypothetical protein